VLAYVILGGSVLFLDLLSLSLSGLDARSTSQIGDRNFGARPLLAGITPF